MKHRYLLSAINDAREAGSYYNKQAAGLGREFRQEIRKAISRICKDPMAWPQLAEKFRWCLVNRFPYKIIYRIEQSEIVIVAVMHPKRHPERWRSNV